MEIHGNILRRMMDYGFFFLMWCQWWNQGLSYARHTLPWSSVSTCHYVCHTGSNQRCLEKETFRTAETHQTPHILFVSKAVSGLLQEVLHGFFWTRHFPPVVRSVIMDLGMCGGTKAWEFYITFLGLPNMPGREGESEESMFSECSPRVCWVTVTHSSPE